MIAPIENYCTRCGRWTLFVFLKIAHDITYSIFRCEECNVMSMALPNESVVTDASY